ncbi:ROK family transcriptional regulator [Roseomonas aerophila]|uniref:ROK family transcriptional regulator n=1 Tax=Teichococcus aerophilus TaxID=1224513 RepID=A0ABR7RNF0_9PROT|nr:ROK family transcriptional regulator [Pseudoroseomonas aerophila]MBC9207868.1 ROK family transcriptional regulator [Pseudoroseomonas aerophila]
MPFINTPPLEQALALLAMPDEAHFSEAPERDRARVLRMVAAGVRSRPELVERLGLRSTTASRAVAALLERRLLVEASGEKQGRGRPAATLALNPHRLGVSVIHAASRAFIGVLLGLDGSVVAREMLPVSQDADNEAIGAALAGLAGRLAAQAPPGMLHAGTVASVSGIVDGPRWLIASRWPRMRDFDIAAAIAPVAGPVDVVRQLDAEFRSRALADPAAYAEAVVLLHWGWGIGMAYGKGGEPFGVGAGPFGEIGHWRLEGLEERRCDCGRSGCLETSAALWAMLPALRHRWPELSEDEDELLLQLPRLDLLALPDIRVAAHHMVRAMANLSLILFPARIVINSPLLANAALWAHVEALFRAAGSISGLPMPVLCNEPMPAARGIAGAAGPLMVRALEHMLRGPGQGPSGEDTTAPSAD